MLAPLPAGSNVSPGVVQPPTASQSGFGPGPGPEQMARALFGNFPGLPGGFGSSRAPPGNLAAAAENAVHNVVRVGGQLGDVLDAARG